MLFDPITPLPDGDFIFVDAGNIFTASKNIRSQNGMDLLNSNLLAQLAASKKYDRFSKADDWDRHYYNTLSNLAWRTGVTTHNSYQPPGLYFSIPEVVCKMFAAAFMPDEGMLAKTALGVLSQQPSDSAPRLVFDKNSHACSAVNFLISVVNENGVVRELALSFSTSEVINKLLEQKFLTRGLIGKIDARINISSLYEAGYATLRAGVLDKLGNRINENIFDITPKSEIGIECSQQFVESLVI